MTSTDKSFTVIFLGSSQFALPILELLYKQFTIKLVISQPDKPVGRKKVSTQTPIAQLAQKLSLKVLKPERLDGQFNNQYKAELEADLFVVVAYGQIIPKDLLDIPKLGCLNVHPSLLPKYRGASPIQSAILNGDQVTGITIMLMDEKLDHGPILASKEIEISDQDNYDTLSNKISHTSAPFLIETIHQYLKGKIKPNVQNHAYASFCTQIKKKDGYFDINNPPLPEKFDRMIRAYYPWPNVWTKWHNKIIKFYPPPSHPEEPANSGSILIQMEGRNKIKLSDFLNGHPDFPLNNILSCFPIIKSL